MESFLEPPCELPWLPCSIQSFLKAAFDAATDAFNDSASKRTSTSSCIALRPANTSLATRAPDAVTANGRFAAAVIAAKVTASTNSSSEKLFSSPNFMASRAACSMDCLVAMAGPCHAPFSTATSSGPTTFEGKEVFSVTVSSFSRVAAVCFDISDSASLTFVVAKESSSAEASASCSCTMWIFVSNSSRSSRRDSAISSRCDCLTARESAFRK
mmetsp:Transcript_828/g.3049  ORF Transcript_828/g.3049 Transcript_828/m.3049 type:complete len:214 (+) Transcript_828:181-822(+)